MIYRQWANSVITFSTSNQTWRQVFGAGTRYVVPRFQRDYSWTKDEWDDLWQDILGTMVPDGEPAHYMGYLVLQTKDQRTFEVIDGQQRLTTLSLFVMASLRALQDLVDAKVDPEVNSKRIEQLRAGYIGYIDPVTLVPQSKLTLNRNNNAYYQDFIVPLQRLPQRKLRASEHLLRKAFEWFYDQIRKEYESKRDGAALARLVDDLSDRLFFTVITVNDELNAFKVFETLNARGVRLSPADLLKNYLFSVVSRETSHTLEIDTLERRWEAIADRLGGESFPAFLRVHWNSRRSFVREADLFKTIRERTRDKAAVFELIRQMEEDVGFYAALLDPEDAIWQNDQDRYVRELRMFSVRQPWPLLMAASRAYQGKVREFTEILRACSIISFRYNVIGGLAGSELERAYNSVALRIAEGALTSAAEVIRALSSVYISDESFRGAFSEKVLKTTSARNKHIARHILFHLEKHFSGNEYDADSPRYTVEHILPENPSEDWEAFSDEQRDESVYRLGNLTLLEDGANRSIGNGSFAEKRKAFAESVFEITRKVAEDNADWNLDRLAVRQKSMAKAAASIWRIAQLG